MGAWPMSVRYSDVRLERSSSSERIVTLAPAHLFRRIPPGTTGRTPPTHAQVVTVAQHAQEFRGLVQGQEWGVEDAPPLHSPSPKPSKGQAGEGHGLTPQPTALQEKDEEEDPEPEKTSASRTSDPSSDDSSSENTSSDEQKELKDRKVDVANIDWILPRTRGGQGHTQHDPLSPRN